MERDDPNLPKDAIYISAVNEDVKKVNKERLECLDGKKLTINCIDFLFARSLSSLMGKFFTLQS